MSLDLKDDENLIIICRPIEECLLPSVPRTCKGCGITLGLAAHNEKSAIERKAEFYCMACGLSKMDEQEEEEEPVKIGSMIEGKLMSLSDGFNHPLVQAVNKAIQESEDDNAKDN